MMSKIYKICQYQTAVFLYRASQMIERFLLDMPGPTVGNMDVSGKEMIRTYHKSHWNRRIIDEVV